MHLIAIDADFFYSVHKMHCNFENMLIQRFFSFMSGCPQNFITQFELGFSSKQLTVFQEVMVRQQKGSALKITLE